MKNSVLTAALKVSQESVDNSEELLDQLRDDPNPVSADSYVEDRLELEQDMGTLEETAVVLDGDTLVSQESLDNAAALVSAVMGRYGITVNTASLESAEPGLKAKELAAQIRGINASLEGQITVAMESYSMTDLWDKIGLLNREVPNLKDNVSVLKNYASSHAKLAITPAFGRSLVYAFRVDGSVPDNIPKAAGETASIIGDLIKYGTQLVDDAKKAADIAMRADWKDQASADKAISAINGINPNIAEVYRRFDQTFTMGNRRLNVKKFDIKGAPDGLKNWATGGSLNVSWPKSTLVDMIFDPGVVMVVEGSRKRVIKVEELTGALDKFLAAASATQQMRSNSPKKWSEHKALTVRMKKDVQGSGDAQGVQRAIIETSRLGWQCLNGAVTVLYFIIREINLAAERVAKDARKNSRS
ncbi:hypothetical protein D3C73_209860 [compost metagenome]